MQIRLLTAIFGMQFGKNEYSTLLSAILSSNMPHPNFLTEPFFFKVLNYMHHIFFIF